MFSPYFKRNKVDLRTVKKVKQPITGPEGLRGFQEVKVLRFRDNGTGW